VYSPTFLFNMVVRNVQQLVAVELNAHYQKSHAAVQLHLPSKKMSKTDGAAIFDDGMSTGAAGAAIV
jgi:adenine/guanine phosphoribosyltransferase-like PRPP-binding protein